MISSNYYYSPSSIRAGLDRAVSYVSDNIACYCTDPGIAFTRNRKLGCEALIHYLIQLSDRSVNSDLMNHYDFIEDMPSASAVCQQRYKLESLAVKSVFSLFTNSFENYKTYKGYYLLACDGSDINICHNPKDKDTYYIQTPDDLAAVCFHSDSCVGITAGASTPNTIIQEVSLRCQKN